MNCPKHNYLCRLDVMRRIFQCQCRIQTLHCLYARTFLANSLRKLRDMNNSKRANHCLQGFEKEESKRTIRSSVCNSIETLTKFLRDSSRLVREVLCFELVEAEKRKIGSAGWVLAFLDGAKVTPYHETIACYTGHDL